MATNLLKTLPGVVVLKSPLKFQFEFSIWKSSGFLKWVFYFRPCTSRLHLFGSKDLCPPCFQKASLVLNQVYFFVWRSSFIRAHCSSNTFCKSDSELVLSILLLELMLRFFLLYLCNTVSGEKIASYMTYWYHKLENHLLLQHYKPKSPFQKFFKANWTNKVGIRSSKNTMIVSSKRLQNILCIKDEVQYTTRNMTS